MHSLGHFWFWESQNMRFWPKIRLGKDYRIMRVWRLGSKKWFQHAHNWFLKGVNTLLHRPRLLLRLKTSNSQNPIVFSKSDFGPKSPILALWELKKQQKILLFRQPKQWCPAFLRLNSDPFQHDSANTPKKLFARKIERYTVVSQYISEHLLEGNIKISIWWPICWK